jgi:hypothetical protein
VTGEFKTREIDQRFQIVRCTLCFVKKVHHKNQKEGERPVGKERVKAARRAVEMISVVARKILGIRKDRLVQGALRKEGLHQDRNLRKSRTSEA